MIAKSPRMRISTSCSRMFLNDEPRAICARKALRSMKLPSELVLKKSGARLASNQATSASSTDRTKFRLSCCSLARCCSQSAMARLHRVGANAPPTRSDDLANANGANPDSGTRSCGPETQTRPPPDGVGDNLARPNEGTARRLTEIIDHRLTTTVALSEARRKERDHGRSRSV